ACLAPQPSAIVTWSFPRACRQRMTPRTNSGSVVRPFTPSSPPLLAGSLNHSKPPMLGLSRMGVDGGFWGTTASQRRLPRSNAACVSLLWSTTTGETSAAMRARFRARKALPSTAPAVVTTGAPASSAPLGEAWVVTSTLLDGAALGEGPLGADGTASGGAFCVRHPAHASATSTG